MTAFSRADVRAVSQMMMLAVVSAVQLFFSPTAAAQITASVPVPLNTDFATDVGVDYVVDLATDRAGNWVAIWQSDEDRGGAGIDFDIYASTSTDNGATWSAPVFVNSNAATDMGNDEAPAIATDGTGTWIAVWNSTEDLGMAAGGDFDIFWAASTDNGATWSGPSLLNSTGTADSGQDLNAAIATDEASNWVVTWFSSESALGSGADLDIFVSISGDSGATWSAAALLNSTATTDTGADAYPQIATDNGGNWITVWYSTADYLGAGTDADIFYAISTDNGANWGTAGVLNSNAATDAGDDYSPSLAPDRSGNWVVTWFSNDVLSGVGMDYDVCVSHSTDDGATWSAVLPLNTNAATDSGDDFNPIVKTDAAGNWVVVWESDEDLDSADADFDIFVARSIDTGSTWGTPELLTTTASTDGGEDYNVSVATDEMGEWLAAWESSDDFMSAALDFDIFVAPIVLDAIPLTVSIGTASDSITSGGPVSFPITYTGASVIHLTAGDITLNTTGTATGTIGVTNGTTPTPSVTISAIAGDGTLGISIASGTGQDLGANPAPAAGPSATFTVDNTAPTVGIGAPSAGLTKAGPVTFAVTYGGASAVNLTSGSVSLITTGTASGTVSVLNGTTSTPTIQLSAMTGDGTIAVSIASGTASDGAGNTAPAAGPSSPCTVDNTAPTIAIGSPSVGVTKAGPVQYTLTYGGATTINLLPGNVSLVSTGTATGTLSVSNGTTSTPTVTISTISGNGTLGISIAAGTASDAAGNTAAAAGPSTTVTVDNLPPTLVIGAPSPSSTGPGPVAYGVTYTGASTVNLLAANVTLIKTGNANGTVSVINGTTSAPIVTLSSLTGNGTLAISIAAGTASDAAGNTAAGAGPSTAVTVVNNTAPSIALTGGNVILECGAAFVEPGFTATDAEDGTISANVIIGGDVVNTSMLGLYTITYNVTDSGSLSAIQRIRTVTVVDTTAPTIAVTGANPRLVHLNGIYSDAGATATDICDTNLPAVQANTSAVNVAAEGRYVVSYSVTDANGNTGTATRDVVVVDPALAPALCALTPAVLQSQWTSLRTQFGVSANLVAGDVPESYALLLGRTLICKVTGSPWGTATAAAFEVNAFTLRQENQFTSLQPYHAALAVLLSTTADRQAAIITALANGGINLTGSYETVTCLDGSCDPIFAKTSVDGAGNPVYEPFAPTADMDGDGATNGEEYGNVQTGLGGANYFVHLVLTPQRQGTEATSGLVDVNADGSVNAVDIQFAINAALGIDILPQFADVNLDGQANAVDIQRVINAALGL